MKDIPFQRKGGKSNTEIGKSFENEVKDIFEKKLNISLIHHIPVKIGINEKKIHKFDLGNPDEKILIECKSHKWTEGGNIPSAKITTWDQAMFYFFIAPKDFRKIFCILKDCNSKNETLAQYYIRTRDHLIPTDVEIWEFDDTTQELKRLK